MSENIVYYKQYECNDLNISTINRNEIMRYAGMFGAAYAEKQAEGADMFMVMEECIEEVLPLLTYKVSYREETIIWDNGFPVLAFKQHSINLKENLLDCDEVVMFAATIGIGIDRLIAKYSRISPVKALFLQAIGAERIETLCDTFNREVKEMAKQKNKVTVARFSPGYGDLPLDVQKEFALLLDCSRKIGVTLNDSLLMSPSKSVTAIIGIKDKHFGDAAPEWDANARCVKKEDISKCQNCNNFDCEYRVE